MADFSNVTDDAIEEFARVTDDLLSEAAIQREVFRHLKTRGAPNSFAFHPRNSGRDQEKGWQRAINGQLGVVSGVPDVIAINEGKCYALELKKAKGGRLTDTQMEILVRMGHCGVITGVSYGLKAALRWLEGHGLLRGKTN